MADDFWENAARPADDFWAEAHKPVDSTSGLPRAVVAPQPSLTRAMVALKGVQDLPTLGFGDEAGGALQTVLEAGSPEKALFRLALGDKGLQKLYRTARDENRAESALAASEHPGAYYGAGVAASLPLAFLGGGAQAARGAGLGARALAGIKAGAAAGAVGGAGMSEADSLEGLGTDAATGMLSGGVLGGALPVVGEGIGRALAATRQAGAAAAPGLRDVAIASGRRVLTNGADSLSKRGPIAEEAVEEAIRSRAIRPFSTNARALERLGALTEEEGLHLGRVVAQLEANGVEGPAAHELAAQLIHEGRQLFARTGADKSLANRYLNEAENALDLATTRNPIPAAPAERLGLRQAEAVKRTLQREAKYGRFDETPLNEVRRDIASRYRQGVENAVEDAARAAPAGSPVRELAAEFVPTKQRLGRLLEAEAAATRGAARGAQRGGASLTDQMYAAAGLASGNPAGAAKGLALGAGNNFLRNRGRSAVASYGLGLSDALAALPGRQSALIAALRGGSPASEALTRQSALAALLRELEGAPP